MDIFHRTQAWYNSCMTMYKWDLMNLTMLIKGVKHDLIGYTTNVQPTLGYTTVIYGVTMVVKILSWDRIPVSMVLKYGIHLRTTIL